MSPPCTLGRSLDANNPPTLGQPRRQHHIFEVAALKLSRLKIRANTAETTGYRLEEEGALATRIEGAAIFTSTSSIGFFVHACVT